MQSNWKNKLEQWAPEPPAGVWERLSEALAEVPQPPFAQKLHQFSEAPPAKSWEAISTQLDAASKTPIIRLFPVNKIIRYGSIAASVLFAFFILGQFSGSNNTGNGAKKGLHQQTLLPLPGKVGNLGPKKMVTNQATGLSAVAPPALAYSLKKLALHLSKDPMPTIRAERTSTVRMYEVAPAATPDLNDGHVERYIVIPVAEDAAVRLPKKMYDLFRCGDVPIPAGCSELTVRIRQQSATPSFVATADFPGLLELIQQVELHQ